LIREGNMLTDDVINSRLAEMKQNPDPGMSFWPENCEGSRKALVIFVGPSPGGTTEKDRDEIKINLIKPLWNESYLEPLKWSRGFKVSFKLIVERIFLREYEESAKLIARMNMDWEQNPESSNVPYLYMWLGCSVMLPAVIECEPELIIPMDEKTYGILQIALANYGFQIIPAKKGKIKILISNKDGKASFHQDISAFKATMNNKTIVIVKSWQHPARIFNIDYAARVGNAIRSAAIQISEDNIVNIAQF
jgi:hypothetical protein